MQDGAIVWPPGRIDVSLEHSVHVWAAKLDVDDLRYTSLEATLSDDERERASRYRHALTARRFVTGRGILRAIIGAYLQIPPPALRFTYTAHQKPALAPSLPAAGLRFNVAHAGPLALYALARRVPVGVDVEEVLSFPDLAAIAASFFSVHERHELALAAPAEFPMAFYRVWTRKEAFLKAAGTGLLAPLDSFDVSVRAERAELLRLDGDSEAPRHWSLVHLEPAGGFVGALAVRAPNVSVHCRRWTEP